MLDVLPTRAGVSPARADALCQVAQAEGRSAMSESAMNEQFQEWVRAEVMARRGRGLKAAFREVARLFMMTDRRVRACWHGELRTVTAFEWETVKARRIAALREDHARLEREIAALAPIQSLPDRI